MFLVLEGIDGSGTTTQAHLLQQHFGDQALLTNEPSNGVIGKLVRLYLQKKEESTSPEALQMLFCADRLDHISRKIQPALAAGKTVISDRFALSTIAYAPEDWKEIFEHISQKILQPDLTVFLRIDPKEALKRIDTRGEEKELFESLEFLTKTAKCYEETISYLPSEKVLICDAMNSIESIHQQILEAL